MKIDIYRYTNDGNRFSGQFYGDNDLNIIFNIFFSRLCIVKMKNVQFSHLKYTGKNAFPRARLNDRKKNYFYSFFFTVKLLRSKNDFSGGKAPEKINLGNNCRPSVYIIRE